MLVPSKNEREKNNVPADAQLFLTKEIDSTDFKNEHVTTKKRRKKAEKLYIS